MRDELKTTEAEHGETHQSQQLANKASSQTWRILGWLLLGSLIGVILAAAFMAYGQPELLLEQLNLRYCG
jgi:hypothetical protein